MKTGVNTLKERERERQIKYYDDLKEREREKTFKFPFFFNDRRFEFIRGENFIITCNI